MQLNVNHSIIIIETLLGCQHTAVSLYFMSLLCEANAKFKLESKRSEVKSTIFYFK